MKLSECKLGEIVRDKNDNKRIGHIVGLTANRMIKTLISCNYDEYEIVPLVQFVLENVPVGIHYSNIEKLK